MSTEAGVGRSAVRYLGRITIAAVALAAGVALGGSRGELVAQAQSPDVSQADLVALGRAIFFDTTLSTPDGQSCATCHDPASGFADPNHLAVSDGAAPGLVGNRNAPSISYAMFRPALYHDPTTTMAIPEGQYKGGLFWDGRVDTLEEQASQPFLNPLEMHNPDKAAVVVDMRAAEYAALFRRVFGEQSLDDTDKAYDSMTSALAAYMRSDEVNPFTSKYDYYQRGFAEFTPAEARGLALFTGRAMCFNCHSLGSTDPVPYRPLFTNFGHQNLGTPRNPSLEFYNLPPEFNPDGANYIDRGIGDFLRTAGYPEAEAAKEDGKTMIPSLRNCAVTAPYTHNGYHLTLREVVVFNNTRDLPTSTFPPAEVPETVHRHPHPEMMPGGSLGRLGLTDQQIDDLVAFLQTLTDGFSPNVVFVPMVQVPVR